MKKIHVFSLFLLLIVSATPVLAQALRSPMPVHPAPIVAHRGSSATAPENTLAAAKLAVEHKANGCEVDVYRSADGKIILMHDGNLKRTAGLDKKVVDTTYTEMQKLDAGAWKNAKYAGEKIPTLEEYLAVLKGTDCRPVIEIKMEGIEEDVLKAVREADMVDVTVIIAFSKTVVKKMRELEPKLCVAWLYGTEHKGTPQELADLLTKEARWCDTNILDLNHGLINPEMLAILRARGFHVWAWTVDDPNRMEQLLRWGIDSITTNKPDVLHGIMTK